MRFKRFLQVSTGCCRTKRFGLSPSSVGGIPPADEGLSPKRLVLQQPVDTFKELFEPHIQFNE